MKTYNINNYLNAKEIHEINNIIKKKTSYKTFDIGAGIINITYSDKKKLLFITKAHNSYYYLLIVNIDKITDIKLYKYLKILKIDKITDINLNNELIRFYDLNDLNNKVIEYNYLNYLKPIRYRIEKYYNTKIYAVYNINNINSINSIYIYKNNLTYRKIYSIYNLYLKYKIILIKNFNNINIYKYIYYYTNYCIFIKKNNIKNTNKFLININYKIINIIYL